MKSGIIIFARFDSSRLPGKALMDINGMPMLAHVIRRAQQIKPCDQIVLATSDRKVDDCLAEFAQKQSIQTFRGDVDDVADRALKCAQTYQFDIFARLCGDRPFFDPALMADLIASFGAQDDLHTTQSDRPYPPGLTTEVIRTSALAHACAQMTLPDDREHLTRYFYQHPDNFKIVRHKAPENIDFNNIRLVVDDPDDLRRAIHIAEQLDQNIHNAPMADIISAARSWNYNPDRLS